MQKITKILKIVYNRVDFANLGLQVFYLSAVSILTAVSLMFTYAVKYKVYIPNPDTAQIDKIGLASEWYIVEAIAYSTLYLVILMIIFGLIALFQVRDRYYIKKFIKENRIAVIK